MTGRKASCQMITPREEGDRAFNDGPELPNECPDRPLPLLEEQSSRCTSVRKQSDASAAGSSCAVENLNGEWDGT